MFPKQRKTSAQYSKSQLSPRLWRCSASTSQRNQTIVYYNEVQQAFFMTTALKNKTKLVAPARYKNRAKHKFVLLLLHEMYVHASGSSMDSRFLPSRPIFFLALYSGHDPLIDAGCCSAQQLALHCEISTAR